MTPLGRLIALTPVQRRWAFVRAARNGKDYGESYILGTRGVGPGDPCPDLVPISAASSVPTAHKAARSSDHEIKLWKPLDSNSRFVRIPHSVSTCESTTPPEPLTTPTPVIDGEPADSATQRELHHWY